MSSRIRMTGSILLSAATALLLAQGESAYQADCDSLRDAVYLNSPIDSIRARYRAARKSVRSQVEDKRMKLYWLGRVEYLMGRAEQETNGFRQAQRHYDAGIECLDESTQEGLFSEGLRLKSELLGQMCLVQRAMGHSDYVLRNGLAVKSLARKALGLDPKNVKAQIQVASSFVYPSRIYGGDPKKGVEMMQEALLMPTIETDDRFNIYLGLGLSHARLGHVDEAAAFFEKARILYPTNRFLKEQYDKLLRD